VLPAGSACATPSANGWLYVYANETSELAVCIRTAARDPQGALLPLPLLRSLHVEVMRPRQIEVAEEDWGKLFQSVRNPWEEPAITSHDTSVATSSA